MNRRCTPPGVVAKAPCQEGRDSDCQPSAGCVQLAALRAVASSGKFSALSHLVRLRRCCLSKRAKYVCERYDQQSVPEEPGYGGEVLDLVSDGRMIND